MKPEGYVAIHVAYGPVHSASCLYIILPLDIHMPPPVTQRLTLLSLLPYPLNIETGLPIPDFSSGTFATERKLLILRLHYFSTMSSSAAISKVFWPSHLCSRHVRTGFIIGWNVRSFTACIATIVSDIDVRKCHIQHILHLTCHWSIAV